MKPWDTPQRAAPKSCYPCKNKTEKIKKIKIKINNWKKKTIHAFQNEFKKKAPKKEKTEQIPQKESKKTEKFERKIRKKQKKINLKKNDKKSGKNQQTIKIKNVLYKGRKINK